MRHCETIWYGFKVFDVFEKSCKNGKKGFSTPLLDNK